MKLKLLEQRKWKTCVINSDSYLNALSVMKQPCRYQTQFRLSCGFV